MIHHICDDIPDSYLYPKKLSMEYMNNPQERPTYLVPITELSFKTLQGTYRLPLETRRRGRGHHKVTNQPPIKQRNNHPFELHHS